MLTAAPLSQPPCPADLLVSDEQTEEKEEIKKAASRYHSVVSLTTQYRRRARGKSAVVGCFLLIDVVYFIARLVVYVPSILKRVMKLQVEELMTQFVFVDLDNAYCGNQTLALLMTWFSLFALLSYFFAIISLALSAILLNIRLCIIYVGLKTINLLIVFVILVTVGYHCHRWGFYIGMGVFFIVHLPFQTLGLKIAQKFMKSLKQADIISMQSRLAGSQSPTHGRSRRSKASIVHSTASMTSIGRRLATVDL